MAKDSYQLPEQTFPGMAPSDVLADISDFKLLIEELGIRTINTRIERYEQYLKAASIGDEVELSRIFENIAEPPFKTSMDLQLYVKREVHELMWIYKGLRIHIPKGAEDKLRIIVGGSDFAALDVDSSSRNAQFELRIASYFCQEGYRVDLSSDTDIIATKSRDVFLVECKRVTSDKKLLRRLKEAEKQLLSRFPRNTLIRRHYGIIAIDITKLAFTKNGLTLGYTDEHTKDVIQDKLVEVSDRIDLGEYIKNHQNLLLIWLQIHIPALVINPPQLITRFSSYFVDKQNPTGRQLKVFRKLQKVLHVGERGDPRQIPPKKLTVRDHVTFPAGTILGWDEDLLMSFLYSWRLEYREQELTILTLNIDGEEYVFNYFELKSIVTNLDVADKERLQNNPEHARVELAARLFLHRYRYEEFCWN